MVSTRLKIEVEGKEGRGGEIKRAICCIFLAHVYFARCFDTGHPMRNFVLGTDYQCGITDIRTFHVSGRITVYFYIINIE